MLRLRRFCNGNRTEASDRSPYPPGRRPVRGHPGRKAPSQRKNENDRFPARNAIRSGVAHTRRRKPDKVSPRKGFEALPQGGHSSSPKSETSATRRRRITGNCRQRDFGGKAGTKCRPTEATERPSCEKQRSDVRKPETEMANILQDKRQFRNIAPSDERIVTKDFRAKRPVLSTFAGFIRRRNAPEACAARSGRPVPIQRARRETLPAGIATGLGDAPDARRFRAERQETQTGNARRNGLPDPCRRRGKLSSPVPRFHAVGRPFSEPVSRPAAARASSSRSRRGTTAGPSPPEDVRAEAPQPSPLSGKEPMTKRFRARTQRETNLIKRYENG